MTPKKMYYLMLGFSALLSVGLFGTLFASSSLLKGYSNQLVEAKLQNRVLEEQQTSLKTAKEAIASYTELNDIAKAIVPQDKNQAKTVRTISSTADSLFIRLSGISFPPSTLGQSSKNASAKETQVTPAQGLKGVYQMQITVQSDPGSPIDFGTFLEFLRRLENNQRTSQVNSITILPDSKNREKVTFNLVLNTYIKP